MSEIEFVKSQLRGFTVTQVLAATTGKMLKFNCNTSTNRVSYLVEVEGYPIEIYSNIESAINSYNDHFNY